MDKPRFFYEDLKDYNPKKLIEIIMWQRQELENKPKKNKVEKKEPEKKIYNPSKSFLN